MGMPSCNGKIVLISGINGYIASHIGLQLLEKGYSIRGSCRSVDKCRDLLFDEETGPYKKYVDRVELVAVMDITADGAFNEAVKGVHGIIHTASPVDFSLTTLDEFLMPAVSGTTSILTAALRFAGPQVTSFVFTSSTSAVIDESKPVNTTYTEDDWNESAEPTARRLGDDRSSPYLKYDASKTSAERALWYFRAENRPPFAIAAINPCVVTGPPLILPRISNPSSSAFNETVRPVWDVLSGAAKTTGVPPTIGSGTWIDVRDVAAMHIWAFEHPAQSDGQRYTLSNGKGGGQAIVDILRATYPERSDDMPVGEPGEGYVKGTYEFLESGTKYPSVRAKEALGMGWNWVGYEKSIVDTARVLERFL